MTTAQLSIFAALCVQVLLTLVIYLRLVRARMAGVKDPETDRARMGFDPMAWPMKSRLLSNSVISQFELPVLFYVGVLFAFQFGAAGWVVAVLAWLFVIFRIVHAIIHTGSNRIQARFLAFLGSFVCVAAMWVLLAVHVFSRGAV